MATQSTCRSADYHQLPACYFERVLRYLLLKFYHHHVKVHKMLVFATKLMPKTFVSPQYLHII